MKFDKNLLKERWFAYTFALCSAVILFLILTHLGGLLDFLGKIWKTFSPVFMAFVIAYIMHPLVHLYSHRIFHRIEQDKMRHSLSVLCAILSVILFFVILMVALVPQVIDSVVTFAGNLNSYVSSFQRLIQQLNQFAAGHDIDLSQFVSSSDELLQSITRILPENVNKIVNASYGFGARVFDWVISFILAIYLMLDNARLKGGFLRLMQALMPANVYQNTATFWSRCNAILVQYIAFDLLDGLIIGLCNWLFMLFMGMPYVAIVSVIVGVTNLAPTFGPMAGAVIGAFILLLVNPWHALWFLLFTLVLQTLDGYIIKPRLFGGQLGVPAVWILISLIIGGRFLGVAGILLAIPFAAICDFIYHDYFIVWLEQQRAERTQRETEKEDGTSSGSSGAAEESGAADGGSEDEGSAGTGTANEAAKVLTEAGTAGKKSAAPAGAGAADGAAGDSGADREKSSPESNGPQSFQKDSFQYRRQSVQD